MKFIQKKKKKTPSTAEAHYEYYAVPTPINIAHQHHISFKLHCSKNQWPKPTKSVYIYITERRMGWWVREAKKKEKETKKLGYTFLINSKRWKFYVPWIVIIIIIIIWYADFVLFSVVWNTISFSYWFLRPSDSHARTRADFKVCCHRLPAYDMLNTQYRIER